MCSVWISEQTAILQYTALTGFYNRDGVCLLRGREWIFHYNPINFTPQSVNLTMLEPFKRKLTSPSNRYVEAISFGPVHKRMQHLPLLQLQSAIPYHHNPHYTVRSQSFRFTRALCLHGSAGQRTGNIGQAVLSTLVGVSLFIFQLRWLPVQRTAFSNTPSTSVQFLRIPNILSFITHSLTHATGSASLNIQ
jgi:hypothetical protein